jgi:predicted RNase H-like nuclease (RuvC/YqgF family)
MDDKTMIKHLTRELQDLKRKFTQMRRNYDSMSHNAHSDKADALKIAQMKMNFEKEIADLKT